MSRPGVGWVQRWTPAPGDWVILNPPSGNSSYAGAVVRYVGTMITSHGWDDIVTAPPGFAGWELDHCDAMADPTSYGFVGASCWAVSGSWLRRAPTEAVIQHQLGLEVGL